MKLIQMFFEMLVMYQQIKNELKIHFEKVRAETRVWYAEQVNRVNNCNSSIKQLCPKCAGQGIVSRPPHIAADQESWAGTELSYKCNLCDSHK